MYTIIYISSNFILTVKSELSIKTIDIVFLFLWAMKCLSVWVWVSQFWWPGNRRNFDWLLSGHSANGPHSLFTICHNCWEILPVLACGAWVALRQNQNANHVRDIYNFCTVCVIWCPHISSGAQSVVGSLSAHYLVITHNLLQQTCYKDRQQGVFSQN